MIKIIMQEVQTSY